MYNLFKKCFCMLFVLCWNWQLNEIYSYLFSSTSFILYDETLNELAYSHRLETDNTSLPFLMALSFMIYLIGFSGIVLGFKNFFLTMLSTELMYSGVIVAFFLVGKQGHTEFSICGLLLIVIAASESAIGLSILIVLYRFGHSIKISDYQELRSSFAEPQKFSFIVLSNYYLFNQMFIQIVEDYGRWLYASNHLQNYISLISAIVIGIILCLLLVGISYLLSLATIRDREKSSEYECGFAPFDSATRLPFDIHFYLVGILFLVFDVEISLILPWTYSLIYMNWFSFYLVVFFVLILALGFVYEWKQGVLAWNKRIMPFINND